MRSFFTGLLLGLILGVAGYWFVQSKAREHPAAEQRAEVAAAQAGSSASETGQHLAEALKAKLETLDLRSGQIQDELARTGKIVRRKTSQLGEQVADAAEDARIVAAIKARFAAEPDLSVWKIPVSSDQGHVTLSGSVSAEGDIGKAVALALEADGVRDVTSTIAVKPKS
jgi:hypothetical protein